MPLLFAYGSLKQGFANAHVNPGRRVPGQYRTRERFPLYLLGDGEVPCLLAPPGSGHQVIGELYEVNDYEFHRLDRLERVGEPEGYERVHIAVERFDLAASEYLNALVYLKQQHALPASMPRRGPLEEYRREDAGRFWWVGAE